MELVNNTTEPINLGADVKTCKIWTTEERKEKNQNSMYYKFSKCGSIKNVWTEEFIADINIEEGIDNESKEIIDKAHST